MLKPIEQVDTCFIPALFVAGENDDFIAPHHVRDICDVYAGDKNLVMTEGTHDSRRPQYFVDGACNFLRDRICAPAGLTGPADVVDVVGSLAAAPRPLDLDEGSTEDDDDELQQA